MGTLSELLRDTLTPAEYRGFLKGSAVKNILDNGGCLQKARRFIDALALCETSSMGGETGAAVSDKENVVNTAANEAAETTKQSNPQGEKKLGKYEHITADEIRKLYIEQNYSMSTCSEKLNISQSGLGRLMKKYGISKRPKPIDKQDSVNYDSGIADSAELDEAARRAAREILYG